MWTGSMNPALHPQDVHLVEEDPGVHEDPGPDAEAGVLVHEATRDHPDPVGLLSYGDRMARVRPDPATGNDGRQVLLGDVRHDLTLSLVAEETPHDDCAGHYQII
jgi:hypothetical protein